MNKFDRELYERLRNEYSNTLSKESLKDIRYYLDSCGMKMPKPNYVYDHKDKTTHKYLESRVNTYTDNGRINYHVTQVFNPDFKHSNSY